MSDKTSASTHADALLSFHASNVRSYRDEVAFSMLATRLARENVARDVPTKSVNTVLVLPAAGIFGPNGSGKSTFLKALKDMRDIVFNSFRFGPEMNHVDREPFILDKSFVAKPTEFEVDVVVDNIRWQYGFEVDDERVIGECAYFYPKGRQTLVFDRDGNNIKFGERFHKLGDALSKIVTDHSLLLTVAGFASARFGIEESARNDHIGSLFKWFVDNLYVADTNNRIFRVMRTAELVKNVETKERVLRMLDAADLGISDIEMIGPRQTMRSRVQRIMKGRQTSDTYFDVSAESVDYVLSEFLRLSYRSAKGDIQLSPHQISEGTIAWIGLVGCVLDALDGGHVLLVDDIDTNLHPHLVSLLIDMFQNPDINRRCAQLIFSTHDTNQLANSAGWQRGVLGRDQVWFTEKKNDGATSLYSLADYSPRQNEPIRERYLQGRYGAVPIMNPGGVHVFSDTVDT